MAEDLKGFGLGSICGHRYQKQQWLAVCTNLASGRNACSAVVRDVHEGNMSSGKRQSSKK